MPLTDNYIFELDENVTCKPVSYQNRLGIRIAADLYLPKDPPPTSSSRTSRTG
jgi:hypothetical protein